MHNRRVLVIDDDRDFVELTHHFLKTEGATVDTAFSAEDGLRLFRAGRYDLVLLDVMMPGISGWQACAAFRDLSSVPIIMLTALGADVDVARGLDAGADDYLVKPFSSKVLLARARAVLRRVELSPQRWGPLRYDDGHLTFDLARRQVSVQGEPVKLTRTEYHLFECLVCNANHMLGARQILECVWGPEYVDSVEYVHVYVHRLRQKLEPDPQEPRYLLNLPGAGYLFSILNASDDQS